MLLLHGRNVKGLYMEIISALLFFLLKTSVADYKPRSHLSNLQIQIQNFGKKKPAIKQAFIENCILQIIVWLITALT